MWRGAMAGLVPLSRGLRAAAVPSQPAGVPVVPRQRVRPPQPQPQQPPPSSPQNARPAPGGLALNDEQRAAALTEATVARVKAGPGSGKTRVVVARAHHLITAHGVPPPRILAITFTNKAAAELRERLAAVSGSGEQGGGGGGAAPQAGPGPTVLAKTFHGLGAYILRQARGHADILGVDERFKILDADQSERLLRRVVEEVDQQAAEQAGPPLPPLTTGAARMLAERLVEVVSSLKTQLAAAGHFEDATALSAGAAAAAAVPSVARKSRADDEGKESAPVTARWHRKQVQSYYTMYQRRLRENNSADFADLICLPVRLLTMRPAVCEAWRRRLDHLLVDEFQDTDPAQYLLVKLLRADGAGLFVVGDPDQAIYSWRGAEALNMGPNLLKDFPGAATFLLSINYRSEPRIVAAADSLLCALGPPELYRAPVAARPVAAGLPPLSLRVHADPRAEAAAVVAAIRACAEAGQLGFAMEEQVRVPRWREAAVLYRKRDQSRPLEEELTRRGLPYTVLGGKPFWQYKEVADAVAYLNVMLDPLRCDPFLERIVNEPKRSIGSSTLQSLRAAALAAGTTMSAVLLEGCRDGAQVPPAGGVKDPALFAPAIEPGSLLAGIKLNKGSRQGVQSLRGLVALLHGSAARGAPVSAVLRQALALSGYEAELELQTVEGVGKKLAGSKKKDVAEDAQQRLGRLAALADVAADPDSWVSEGDMLEGGAGAEGPAPPRSKAGTDRGLAGVQRFLEHAALVTGQDSDVKGDRNAVRLMTLHASKGLEFARTFIVGLEEGILPSGRSSGNSEGMAEERRLMYVGLTRAKDALYLSRCESRFENGAHKENQPSSFLRPLKLRSTYGP